MQRIFFSGLFITLLLNILIKPLALFGIDAVVQNRVGPNDYGTYFSLLNLSILFNIVLDIGINNYTTKKVAQDPKKAADYFGKVMVLRLILFVIYTLFTLSIGYVIGYGEKQFLMLAFLMFNQLLIMIIQFSRSYFSGFHLFKTDAVISVLDKSLLIILCGFVLYAPITNESFEIFWFIGIQTVCYLITVFVALFLLLRKINAKDFFLDLSFSSDLIKKSIPYAILILLMILYTRSDSVILERLHPNGQFQTGIYAQGFRLLDALYMFGMVFVGVLYPMFSRQIKKAKHEVFPLLNTAGNLLMGGSIFVVITLLFNAESILSLIYNQNIHEAALSFRWLMIGFIGISLNFIFGTLLTANGSLKQLCYISIIAIIINITLNLILIPNLGAEGAAISMLITQGMVAISQFVLAKSIINFPIKLKIVLSYIVFIGLLLSVSLLFIDNPFLIGIQLLIGIPGLFILKFIDINELKNAFIKKGKA